MSFKIVNKNTKTTFCIVIQIFKISRFNLEYGNLKNSNLESQNGYLKFNLENGVLASPLIIPHPTLPPPHLHLQHPPLGVRGPTGFFEIKFEITVF